MVAVSDDKEITKINEPPIVSADKQAIVELFLRIHAAKKRAGRSALDVREQARRIREMLDRLGVLTE